MARTFLCFSGILLSFFWLLPRAAYGVHEITGVRYWSATDHTRIVLDINEALPYKYFSLPNPHRFVVDCRDTIASIGSEPIPVNDAVVNQIRVGQFKRDVLRIVFDLVEPVEAKLTIVGEAQGESGQLVVELFRPDLKVEEVTTQGPEEPQLANKLQPVDKLQPVNKSQPLDRPQPASKPQPLGKRVLVIDPGHGGDDPGAIGSRGTMEKNIVLEFARSLKKAFEEEGGYQVYLTRNDDCFLPLRERTSIAEEHEADLFVSLHADSNRIKKTRGSSVYCLSLKGASDEATRCLAEKENASDLIGGIPFSENDDLNFTLLDLALTNTINSSLRLGALVLREIKKVNPVRFEKPKQAGFKVLKTAEIPSILIELGFISNPTEERLFAQKQFQAAIAQAILSASLTYFDYMAKNEPLHHCPRSARTAGETVSFRSP